ncbi:hypothetical protein [Roseateles sp.]|uniref:hypothetical protein n=1 Tax=Roseateles sp. TaxID=1971397 RepID=UPI002F3F9348
MSEELRQIETDWREITKMILLANGITNGLWSPGVKVRFASAVLGPTLEESLPSGVVSVAGIRLRQVTKRGPLVFDAEELANEDLKTDALQPVERKSRTKLKTGAASHSASKPVAPRKRKQTA